MRIASLQPTATEILVGLGLADSIVGVSHECELDRPILVRSRVNSENLSSPEIDREVRRISARGESLYEIDGDRMASLRPELVFAQSVCDV